MRCRRKTRLAKVDNDQAFINNESSSYLQRKSKLDVEQQLHEMKTTKKRCELKDESSRQKMTTREDNEESRRSRVVQKLRGVNSSHELNANSNLILEILATLSEDSEDKVVERFA